MKDPLIFDQFISAETNTDLLKMESVRQHIKAALNKIKAAPDFEKKPETIHAIDYAFQYIARCQATFQTMQEEIIRVKKNQSESDLEIERLKAKNETLQETIKEMKSWLNK